MEISELFPLHFMPELEGLREGPKMFEWIKNLNGALHGMHSIMFSGLLNFVSSSPQIDNGLLQNLDTMTFKISQFLILL